MKIKNADVIDLGIIAVILSICMFLYSSNKRSDNYIRERVLQLEGPGGACTGIQVRVPSGATYTLTAAHCKAILDEESSAIATTEDGTKKQVFMVDIDEAKDLMLMTSATGKSIEVASKMPRHAHVHTLTHGHRHATYRTDGELLEMTEVKVIKETPECFISIILAQMAGTTPPAECIKTYEEMFMTAIVYPGSSGGPVLNDQGELIGIVSVTESGTIYSGMVPLDQIREFISSR